jgi:adenylate cyclase
MKKPAERRLAAILAADVAGYSRLMGVDEEGTHERLRSLFREVVDPKTKEQHGRIVKNTGDGMLVEFASVVDAVRCGVAIQQGVAERNAGIASDGRIEFRVGIHQGDIIVEDGDIFGDGVNVAARLEALAEPGSICVSARVQEDVTGRLNLAFEDLGEQQVKNIARPIRVYRVRETGAEKPLEALAQPALPLPDKPSVAVLPFTNMSADPEQEFFADGIAEDVITALSRYPSLFVIARNSSFTYKGRIVDVKQVGHELGVRYVLEGSLRKANNRIRVTAQLVEAGTGKHVWAERYDRDLADIFAVQDEITEAVTIAIAPAIGDAERQRAMRKPPENLDAWGAYQRGLWHLGKGNVADNAVAEKFFQQAIDLDPLFASGYTGLAAALSRAGLFQTRDPTEAQKWKRSWRDAPLRSMAAMQKPVHVSQLRSSSAAISLEGEQKPSERLAICPNLPDAHGALGLALMYSGRPKEGLAALETCIRLDPRAPSLLNRLGQVALGLYFCREYAAAAEAANRAIRSFPDRWSYYRSLAAAHGQLGQIAEAREALKKAVSLAPSLFEVRRRPRWWRAEDHAHMLDGLRKAGLPEE